MKEWTIKAFKNDNGDDTFEDWMEKQDVEAQETIRARLNFMSITKTSTWARPYVGNLKGHIHEIRIKCNNKQYRPLFTYGTGRVIILLVGATKKGGHNIIWDPPDAIEIARKRRELVIKDGRYIGDYNPRQTKTKTIPQG